MITLRTYVVTVATLTSLAQRAAPLSTDPLGGRPNWLQKLPMAAVPVTPTKASIVPNASVVLTAAERYSRSCWPPKPQTAYISSDLRLPGAQPLATIDSPHLPEPTKHSFDTSSTSTESKDTGLRKVQEIPIGLEQISNEKDNRSSIAVAGAQASSSSASNRAAELCYELRAEVGKLRMEFLSDNETKNALAKLEQKLSTVSAVVEAGFDIADEAAFQQPHRKLEWAFDQTKTMTMVARDHQNISQALVKASAEEKILSLESQIKKQSTAHKAVITAQSANNITNFEGGIRDIQALLAAAQAREKGLKESLDLAETHGKKAIEQVNALKEELAVVKAAATAEELKRNKLEARLFSANESEVLLKTQLARQKEASTDALRNASAVSEHLLAQVKELEATVSATKDEKEVLQKSIESLSGVGKETKKEVLKLQSELASTIAATAAVAAKSEQVLSNVTAHSFELEAEVEALTTKLASEVASRELAEAATASAHEATGKASFAVAAMRTRSVAQAEDLKEEIRKAQADALEAREEASAARLHAAEVLVETKLNRGWLGRIWRRPAAAASLGDFNPSQSGGPKPAAKPSAQMSVVQRKEQKSSSTRGSTRAVKLVALFCVSSLVTRALIP